MICLTTLNERIHTLRKSLKMSQTEFAETIGASQRSISWSEQPGNKVPDGTIKTICLAYNVNEDWLRNGTEPMYMNPLTFNLENFLQARGATATEIDIIKAYFELEPDIREQLINHFKKRLVTHLESTDDAQKGQSTKKKEIPSTVVLNAAHDEGATKEQKEAADSIMMDDNEWN